MHTKTNEELAKMICDGDDTNGEALYQLIHNLKPLMLKQGRMHLGKIPIYDEDDYIQEGSILIWKRIRDGIIEPVAGHGKGKYRFKNRQG